MLPLTWFDGGTDVKKKPYPKHQKETEFHGSYQEFTVTVLPPDDPEAMARVRKDHLENSKVRNASKKRGGKKPKD
jgi:hypothetical protein